MLGAEQEKTPQNCRRSVPVARARSRRPPWLPAAAPIHGRRRGVGARAKRGIFARGIGIASESSEQAAAHRIRFVIRRKRRSPRPRISGGRTCHPRAPLLLLYPAYGAPAQRQWRAVCIARVNTNFFARDANREKCPHLLCNSALFYPQLKRRKAKKVIHKIKNVIRFPAYGILHLLCNHCGKCPSAPNFPRTISDALTTRCWRNWRKRSVDKHVSGRFDVKKYGV